MSYRHSKYRRRKVKAITVGMGSVLEIAPNVKVKKLRSKSRTVSNVNAYTRAIKALQARTAGYDELNKAIVRTMKGSKTVVVRHVAPRGIPKGLSRCLQRGHKR